jgi:hypothetical protein
MLSMVELNERVRALRPAQRVGYSLSVALVIVLAFCAAIVLSIILALVWVVVFVGGPLTLPEDAIVLGLPLVLVFMFTVGIGGMGRESSPAPGQDMWQSAWRAARSGFIVGAISGAIFGFLWSFMVRADPPRFALIVGLSLAPALAFFRSIAHIVEPVCLRLVARQ